MIRFLIAFLFCLPLTAQDYWVVPGGAGTQDGLTEANAFDQPNDALALAVAGDVIAVKAGDYNDIEIITVRSGTSGNPIQIIGYTTTFGDIVASNGPTFSKTDWENQGFGTPTNTGMPYLNFESRNLDPGSGDRPIQVFHDWIEIHNIVSAFGRTNIRNEGQNNVFNNIVMYKAGYWVPDPGNLINPVDEPWNNTQGAWTPFISGYGFYQAVGTGNTTITNCISMDNGLVNYFFADDNGSNTVQHSYSLQHEPGAGTDYGFDFFNSSNNVIEDCYAERYYTGSIGHVGRGIIFQNYADNNIVRRFTAVNLKVVIENAVSNYIEDITMTGNAPSPVTNADYASIQIYGNAQFNVVNRFLIQGGNGIEILNTSTDRPPLTPYERAAQDNYFLNGIIRDPAGFGTTSVLHMRFLSNNVSIASRRNYLINSVVEGSFSRFTRVSFNGGDFTFINCNFSGFTTPLFDIFASGATTYDYEFINCNDDPGDNLTFPSNSFNTLTNSINLPSQFLDANYTIAEGSNLHDAGVEPTFPGIVTPPTAATILGYLSTDYYGNTRPQGTGWDIGIFESGGASPPVNPPGVTPSSRSAIKALKIISVLD